MQQRASILGVVLVNALHECSGHGMLTGVSGLVLSRLLFRQPVLHPFIEFWLAVPPIVAKDFSTFCWVDCT